MDGPMVDGIDKLKRRLIDQLPKVMREKVEAAMLESADEIVAAARLRAPVATGEVRDSIRQHGVKEGARGGLYVAITSGDPSTTEESHGTNYQIARLLEFGTVAMPAQPFMLPAYRSQRRRAKARIRRAMRDAVMWKG
jgi:HK97 gp10 family phage protein